MTAANGVGSFGRSRVFEDFCGAPEVTAMTTIAASAGNIGYVCVNEGTMVAVKTKPNGVWAFTVDTADDDNFALYAGPFIAGNGGCVMEARFRSDSATLGGIFCGFAETLDATTPVMPSEFATATLTVNPGNQVGMLWDSDATTKIWKAVAGASSAAFTGAPTNGATSITADTFDVVRVEVDPSGFGKCFLNGAVVKKFTTAISTTCVLHAVLMIENRSAAARTLSVDYFFAEGERDWTTS